MTFLKDTDKCQRSGEGALKCFVIAKEPVTLFSQ